MKSESDERPDFNTLSDGNVRDIVKKIFPDADFQLLEKCVSTQTSVREALKCQPAQALLIIARSQSGGFGRFGRKFYSPPGGLWLSFFVPSSMAALDENCAIKAAEKLKERLAEELSLTLRTKEPNDIVTAAGSKLAGIIVTGIYRGSECLGSVIGVGMNVNNDTDFDAVNAASLKGLSGEPVRLEYVLQLCLQSIAALVYDKA